VSQIVSFIGYTPAARFDSIPWSETHVEEGATATGPWTLIDTIALSPLDADPADPQTRNLTTDQASDTPNLWYRLTFFDGNGSSGQPSAPIQNTTPTTFTTRAELARILKLRTPSDAQNAAMDRVIAEAAGEIRAEIDLADGDELEGWETDLCAAVNLDRAADLWRHTESIPGITGLLGDEAVGPAPGRYSWERYAQRLAAVKRQWGVA
jgi:hypothetical protein